jgi:hypothetical protein
MGRTTAPHASTFADLGVDAVAVPAEDAFGIVADAAVLAAVDVVTGTGR